MFAVNLCLFLVVALSHIVVSEKAVVCYYGTWATYRTGQAKFDVEHINPHLCTHLVYAFAVLDPKGHVISHDAYLDLPDNYGRDNFGKFNALKKVNPNLKTLLAVGGWNEGSAQFSTMAGNPALRRNFINSALKMISKYGFDGLDIDWEYPNQRDTARGAADIDNFTILLKEIRAVFDKQGLLLTAAVAALRSSASQSYDVKGISEYLDIVNIMAYDMNGAWSSVTGHNAPLHKSEGDTDNLNTVEQALDYWIGAGCPPEKIALGIPFYGRTFTLANANENGVRAPITGPGVGTDGQLGYNELCVKLQDKTWTRRVDSSAGVPFAVKDKDWVSYDDPQSITTKIDYAASLNITKIMIWSIETDDFHGSCGDGVNPLLTAINKALGFDVNASSVSSDSSGTTGTLISTESPSTSGTLVFTGSPSLASDIVCKEEGHMPKPGDCTSFLYCMKDAVGGLMSKEEKCPAGLYWDQSILACNYPSMVDCK